jgi:hypothetical protein
VSADLHSLATLSSAQTRSISPKNFDGAKGGGARATEGTGSSPVAELGQGFSLRPRRRCSATRSRRRSKPQQRKRNGARPSSLASTARPARGGERIEFVVDSKHLHFFDLETGVGIYN